MKKTAPIVLFVYNRLKHTKKTIQSLQRNYLAKQSDIYIYSDGGKDEQSWAEVYKIREYLETISGFKKITFIKRNENIGLSKNIIDGVTTTINNYGKIIVLEDDIVTSPYFLNFMNDSLDFYEQESKVWHISGWNYPISSENLKDTFLWRTMNCWGWATWKDRWKQYEKNPKKLISIFNHNDISRFNLDNSTNFWEQIKSNHDKKMNTWAIFWYAIIFKSNGLCLNPTQSFTENIGFDGTGTNTGYRNNYSNNLSRLKYNIEFENELRENKTATDRIKLFFREQENKNLSFSKNLNKIFNLISKLKIENKKYILYGSGTGMDLVSSFLNENIEFIIDNDLKKHNSTKNGIKIIGLAYFKDYDSDNHNIIITVFGRASQIIETLVNEHQISKDRLISLDIFETN